MNIDLTNHIYKDLKEYILAHCQYSPNIIKKSVNQFKKFPLITLVEENNQFDSGNLQYKARDVIDTLYWEVNIYATDKGVNGKTISNAEICDELKYLVDEVMSKRYRLTRLSCRPTPNLDDTIYRITMRYSCNLFVNKKRII